MAERRPAEALQHYRERLQQAVSCVTDAILLRSADAPPEVVQSLFLSENPARLQSNALWLEAWLQYRIVPVGTMDTGWDIEPGAYAYALLDASQRELFAYHWHPQSRSPITFPHLHLGSSGQVARLLSNAHFPTGPVTLPEVIRLIITDFEVSPRRGDWVRLLRMS